MSRWSDQTYQTSFAPSPMGGLVSYFRRRSLLTLVIPALLLIYLFTKPIAPHGSTPSSSPSTSESLGSTLIVKNPHGLDIPPSQGPGPRLRQATMLYEGDQDGLREMYIRSVNTHIKYGMKWGYPTHVLGRDLVPVEGKGGYFNKPAWLLNIILTEMAKPPGDANRAEWVVWFDGDSIIMNPSVPWTQFLPPPDIDDIHFLGTKDENGFNAGILVLRVHPWTVMMLSQVIGLKGLDSTADLRFYDQSAFENIFSRPENRGRFIYQPRNWWNRYFWTPDGREPGEFLLHFAGIGTGPNSGGVKEKEGCMTEFLNIAESTQSGEGPGKNFERPLDTTKYPAETRDFWNTITKTREVLKRTQQWEETNANADVAPKVKDAAAQLLQTLLWDADYPGNLTRLSDDLSRLTSQ